MPQILILADDMTGANDTGCAIHELGIDVCSVNDLSLPAPLAENFQCLSVNLNSRSLPPKDAAQAVNQAATRFSSPDTILYSKRIDSTLRGNLGSECTALLDWLDNGASCIVVPSFPTAGRVYQNGIVSVHGIPLNQTAAAQDPEHPICTSSPAQIFQMQTDLSLRAIPLDTVRSPSSLLSQIKSCYEQHVRIILIEAVTLSDLDQIAEAVIKSEIPFVCVDPGPFTASVAKHLTFFQASSPRALPTPRGHKTLLVIGSVNAVTRQQVSYLSAHRAMTPVLLDVEQLLAGPSSAQKAVQHAVQAILRQSSNQDVLLLALSTSVHSRRLDFQAASAKLGCTPREVGQMVNQSIAQAAALIIGESDQFGALFSCGGDITAALMRQLKSNCMQVLGESLPLAVCVQLDIGYYLLTKGGMVGGPDAIDLCVQYLSKLISLSSHS